MYAELAYVAQRERLVWALGCLLAAIKERCTPMETGTLRISRPVLLLELIVCFAPITIAWFDVAFGTFGVTHLSTATVREYFLDSPLGMALLAMMIGGSIIGLIGPVGLLLGMRAAITGRGLQNRSLGMAMVIGIASYAMASVALRLIEGPGAYAADISFIVLIVALPIFGIAHLMYVARPATASLPAM